MTEVDVGSSSGVGWQLEGPLPVAFERALAAAQDEGDGEEDEPLSDEERHFAEHARAENTRRAYRSDLLDFAGWCQAKKRRPLPAAASTVSAYLIYLAGHGAKVPTMSRRLSSIAYLHRFAGKRNPVESPRVQIVWEGIRRERAQPVDQAPPLMPPLLWEVLAELPADLSGVRDRALLLVGFVGALRRSELAAIKAEHVGEHPRGLVLSIPRSKTDPYSEGQLVVLPYSSRPERCPVVSLRAWLDEAGIREDYVFRAVHRNGKSVRPLRQVRVGDQLVTARGMTEAAINDAVQRACRRVLAGAALPYSAHSLRAGFATYASQKGLSDRAIAHQTRHRSLASLNQYIRIESAWTDNAATGLDL